WVDKCCRLLWLRTFLAPYVHLPEESSSRKDQTLSVQEEWPTPGSIVRFTCVNLSVWKDSCAQSAWPSMPGFWPKTWSRCSSFSPVRIHTGGPPSAAGSAPCARPGWKFAHAGTDAHTSAGRCIVSE